MDSFGISLGHHVKILFLQNLVATLHLLLKNDSKQGFLLNKGLETLEELFPELELPFLDLVVLHGVQEPLLLQDVEVLEENLILDVDHGSGIEMRDIFLKKVASTPHDVGVTLEFDQLVLEEAVLEKPEFHFSVGDSLQSVEVNSLDVEVLVLG